MGEFQPWHLVVVLVVALLLFGPRKLPELGKGLGEAMRGFKATASRARRMHRRSSRRRLPSTQVSAFSHLRVRSKRHISETDGRGDRTWPLSRPQAC